MNVELALGGGHTVRLDRRGEAWRASLGRPSGSAEALLALVRDGGTLPERWDLLRLADPPDVRDERPSPSDGPNRSDVVGERVVVTWVQRLIDGPHPAPAALAQLTAAGFEALATPYTLLTWTSPSGHVLPVALIAAYLPDAQEGWSWCLDRPDAAASIGATVADLHAAFARPTQVFARPVHHARPGNVTTWRSEAVRLLTRGREVADPETVDLLDGQAAEIVRRLDRDLDADALAGTPVVHLHGDLHVGQILRWEGGIALVDFDGDPVLGGAPALSGPPRVGPGRAAAQLRARRATAAVRRCDPRPGGDPRAGPAGATTLPPGLPGAGGGRRGGRAARRATAGAARAAPRPARDRVRRGAAPGLGLGAPRGPAGTPGRIGLASLVRRRQPARAVAPGP